MKPPDQGRSRRTEIFTIGYGHRSFGEISELLASHRAQTIVDVRSVPYSRRAPDFRKDRLTQAAAVAGLGYRWMGDRLGGRVTDPALLDPVGKPDWQRIADSPGFRGALAELSVLAKGGRVVLLCAEGHPDRCHRARLIAPRLEEQGFTVQHILPDGTLRRHQSSLFGTD